MNNAFSREGRSLGEWLLRLVSEDPAERKLAGDWLGAIRMGVPSPHKDLQPGDLPVDMDAYTAAFKAALNAAVTEPGFDTADFVRRLTALRIAMGQDWLARCDQLNLSDSKRDKQYDRLAGKLVDVINTTADEAEKANASRRMARLSAMYICGGMKQDSPLDDAESMKSSGIESSIVYSYLNRPLWSAPDALAVMFANPKQRRNALAALERIGPAAAEYVPTLLAELDALPEKSPEQRNWCNFEAGAALASVGRGDPQLLQVLIDRLSHAEPIVRSAAAITLLHRWPDVGGRQREIADLLGPMVEDERTAFDALAAYACIGRDLADVRQRVITMAGDRPPVWRTYDHAPTDKYNVVMYERGRAIDVMRFFAAYPAECVSTLVDAIKTFEEYDPDMTYGGPCERVCYALQAFGPAAAEASEPLARRLRADDREDFPRVILQTLGKMGPAATAVRPLLLAYRQAKGFDEPLVDSPDIAVDPLDWAIEQITAR